MNKAKIGDRVRVQCLALLTDGSPAERTRGREVLEFTVGSSDVIRGISFGVVGMSEGDQKRLRLAPRDAYGVERPGLKRAIPKERMPEKLKLRVGKRLVTVGRSTGTRRPVWVREIHPDSVIVDGNHPLAGHTLEVELQLVSLTARGTDKRKR